MKEMNKVDYVNGFGGYTEEEVLEFRDSYEATAGDPVRPSDKGFYQNYSRYRNENWKVRGDHRKDYAFPFSDGTYGVVKPGDVSPVDGKPVTKEDIDFLHRCRDNEVHSNNKYRHKDVEDYDFLEQLDTEKEKMLRGLPNQYDAMQEEYDRVHLVIDQGALVNDGEEITEGVFCGGHIPTPEEALGLTDNPLKDSLAEIYSSLNEEEQEVYQLVWVEKNTRTAVAEMLGVSEGTIRYRLDKIKEKMQQNRIIMSYVDLTGEEKKRRDAWKKEQREKAKAYEERHKVREKNWKKDFPKGFLMSRPDDEEA